MLAAFGACFPSRATTIRKRPQEMRTAGQEYQNDTKRSRGPTKRKLHKGVPFHPTGRKGAEKQPIVKMQAAEMHYTSISAAHSTFFSRTKLDFLAEKGGSLAAKAEIACRKTIRQRAEEGEKPGTGPPFPSRWELFADKVRLTFCTQFRRSG